MNSVSYRDIIEIKSSTQQWVLFLYIMYYCSLLVGLYSELRGANPPSSKNIRKLYWASKTKGHEDLSCMRNHVAKTITD